MSTEQGIVIGDTIQFVLEAEKDGVVWDISGGTVQLYLQKPDGTEIGPLSASITNGAGGIASYTTNNTQLDQEGNWIREWFVSKSGIELWSEEINFEVHGRIPD